MTTKTTTLREEILKEAAKNNSKYLVSHNDWLDKGDVFRACDALVDDALAQWDRYSSFAPCIVLTSRGMANAGI